MTAVLEATMHSEKEASRVSTTLFDLIGEMQERFGPEADERIVADVMRLLQTGRITFLRPDVVAERLADEEAEPVYS